MRGRRRGGTWLGRAVAAAGLALLLLGRLAALAQHSPPSPSPALLPPLGQRPSALVASVWNFPSTPVGPQRAVVLVPAGAAPGERFPLLVALHGYGESLRGVDRGAWGWARDYELGASDAELRRHRLREEAFLGFVGAPRLARLRADLARRPYGGVVVVCPYTPDVLGADAGALSEGFGDWVVGTLLPKARAELPVLADRAAAGVDGVSLGGLQSLELGLAHPEAFGVVGALQAAVHNRADRVLARYVPAPGRPTQRVRLVTSTDDPYRGDNLALDAAMTARGIAHEIRVVEGPHDYVFNRGAGGVEMLLFHDRAQRGLAAE